MSDSSATNDPVPGRALRYRWEIEWLDGETQHLDTHEPGGPAVGPDRFWVKDLLGVSHVFNWAYIRRITFGQIQQEARGGA